MKKIKHVFNTLIYRSKLPTKLLSMLLTLILVFYCIPTVIYGELAEGIDALRNGDTEEHTETDNGSIYDYKGELYEVEALREESVKHFRLEDGSYVAAQYGYPVHIADADGKFVDIDNSLAETSGGEFSSSDSRIKFAKKITGNGSLFTLHDGNAKITLSLIGSNKRTIGVATNSTDDCDDTEIGKLMNLERLSSTVRYSDIIDGVDIEYIVHSLDVKENIIVKEKKDSYSYSFELKLNGLTAALAESGDILISHAESGKLFYTVPAPVVFDANGNYAPSELAYFTLTESDNEKYIMTVTVSSEWMNSEERAFPVTVDPTLTNPSSSSTVIATDIHQYGSTSSTSEQSKLRVNAAWHTYVKFTQLPTIPSNAYISSARFYAYMFPETPGLVALYNVITDWDETITWNDYTNTAAPKGKIYDTIVDCAEIKNGSVSWNIEPLLNIWRSGTNYGFALKVPDDYPNGGCYLPASPTNVAQLPYISIKYTSLEGLEDYLSYSSHDIGAAGIGSVNLATGNLTLVIPTLSTTDSLMSYTPTLVYNSAVAVNGTTDSYMPRGFRLNMHETVVKKSYVSYTGTGTSIYYVYTDADGTEHSFVRSSSDSNKYVDESGLQKTLEVDGNNIKITDSSKTVCKFTKQSTYSTKWQLSSVSDKNGNQLIFTYDTSNRPIAVSVQPNGLSVINFLELHYNSSGKLAMVYNPATKEAVILRGSTYLNSIDYVKGTDDATIADFESFISSSQNTTNLTKIASAMYSYSSSGRISTISENPSKKKINYSWLTNNKVSAVKESADSKTGQSINFTYYNGATEIKSSGSDDVISTSDDIITRYIFDEYGRARAAYSTSVDGSLIHSAAALEYETRNSVRNNTKKETVLGSTSANYVLNGAFDEYDEGGNLMRWTTEGDVSKISYTDYTGGSALSFKPANGGTAAIYQKLSLPKGKYTLSMPYLVQRAEGITATAEIYSLNGTGLNEAVKLSLNPNIENGIQNFFETTFEVGVTTDEVMLRIEFASDSTVTVAPRIELYSVMLSNSVGSSRYNMVSFGGFAESYLGDDLNTISPSLYWKTQSNVGPTLINTSPSFNVSAKITTDLIQRKYIKQRIYEADADLLDIFDHNPTSFYSNAGHEYIVSGFAKKNISSTCSKGVFAIIAEVVYYQGENGTDVKKTYRFNFNPGITGWQFTGGSFNTAYEAAEGDTNNYTCVKAIDIYCEFSYQPEGYALFDNISVVNDTGSDVTKKYYYTDSVKDGLLKKVENIFYKEYYFYDNNRNLIKLANNKGEMTEYTYTDTSNVSTVTKSDFKYLNYSYDYPFTEDDSEAIYVNKTPKTETVYAYNNYGLCVRTVTSDLEPDSTKRINSVKSEYSYATNPTTDSKIFGVLIYEGDGLGMGTRYFYDTTDGKLLASVNQNGTGMSYTYDDIGNLQFVIPATYTASGYSSGSFSDCVYYTYDGANRLQTIETDSTKYTFTYDAFGNTTATKVGTDTVLATYTYASNNGKLQKITYATGLIEKYVYNELDFLTEIWYTTVDADQNDKGTLIYSYEYTDSGALHKFTDHINGCGTVYKYDNSGRLIRYSEYDTEDMYHDFSIDVSYNDRGYLWGTDYELNHMVGDTESVTGWYDYYSYRADGVIEYYELTTPLTRTKEDIAYDIYDRLSSTVYNNVLRSNTSSSFKNTVSYTYTDSNNTSGNNFTSGLIKTYTSKINSGAPLTYTYTYDANGNITRIQYSTGQEIRYEYDSKGQLIREDNGLLNKTYVTVYDNAGNILEKLTYSLTSSDNFDGVTPLSINEYTYSSGDWGDQLLDFNGYEITYDEIGNPLTYYNGSSYAFTWNGRQLVSAEKGIYGYTFTYNDEGIRTSKVTNSGEAVEYFYNGTQLVAEKRSGTSSTSGRVFVYLYDASGSPIGMQHRYDYYAEDVWDTYWFEKNLQGDIVKVYNHSGALLISYTYDAWGNATVSYSNNGQNTNAKHNPFRYRGYYYDADLGLYYLGTRYYDANTGRFINADDTDYLGADGSLLSYNLFAYCKNNPIMNVDPLGKFSWESAFNIATVITIVAVAVVVIVSSGGTAAPPIIAAASAISGTALTASTVTTVATGIAITGVATMGITATASMLESNNKDEKDYVQARNNNQANQWARDVGYNGAEELKADFVGRQGSKFNMFTNRATGEIILIGLKTAAEIATHLFRW